MVSGIGVLTCLPSFRIRGEVVPIGHWNDEEDRLLQGLSPEAQVIYLRGIRRFAGPDGVAGIVRKINRASLNEVCSFEPDPCSKRKPQKLKWDQTKHRVAELVRAGLIVERGLLVFDLPYAAQDKSVQNMTARRRHDMTAPKTTQMTEPMTARNPKSSESSISNGLSGAVGGDDGTIDGMNDSTDDAPPNIGDDGTTSPITINTTTTAREAVIFQEQVDTWRKFAMTLDWQPTASIQIRAKMQGVNPDKITEGIIRAFSGHHEAKGGELNQSEWENLLVKWIKRERPGQQFSGADVQEAARSTTATSTAMPVKDTEYWKPEPKRMMTAQEKATLNAARALLK